MQLPYNYYMSKCDHYYSEIAFINTQIPIIRKTIFFIESKNNDYMKTDIYVDNDKQNLKEITHKFRDRDFFDEFIGHIQPSVRYYSYIKVIKDENNPQLEGENMIFYFGKKICDKIENYLFYHTNFRHTFQLRMYKKEYFPVYDDCLFSNNICEIHEDFNIESQLNFKVYNRLKLDRRKKLENIFKNVNIL